MHDATAGPDLDLRERQLAATVQWRVMHDASAGADLDLRQRQLAAGPAPG